MINTIVFDMDGVLVTKDCREVALEDACRQISLETGKLWKEIWDLIISKWKKERGVKKYDWDLHIRKVQEELGSSLRIDYAALIRKCLDKARAYQDVLSTLIELKRKGNRLILVTNGFLRYQKPILEHLELDRFFERIFSSDFGYMKPDPRIFGENYEEWLKDRKILLVGDRLYQDIYLGRKIKAKTFLLDRGYRRKWNQELDVRYLREKLNFEMEEDKFKGPLNKVLPDCASNDLRDVLEVAAVSV